MTNQDPGEHAVTRRGMVNISRRPTRGAGIDTSAHVHDYATSTVYHELRLAEEAGHPCVIAIDEPGSVITIFHIFGDLAGWGRRFTPYRDDAVGWDELLTFMRGLMLGQTPCTYITTYANGTNPIWVLET